MTVGVWIDRAARLGHLATGAVYLIVGGVALVACFEVGMRPAGSQGALHRALPGDAGAVGLFVLAFGLGTDALWQAVRAVLDPDRSGAGLAGIVDRISWLVSGAIHGGLAITAVKLALGIRQHGGETAVKWWTAMALAMPFGRLMVAGAGIVVIVVGVVLLHRAWRGDIDRWLDLRDMTQRGRAVVLGLGRFGFAARSLVLGLVGAFLVTAAVEIDPGQARGLGGTLRTVQYSPYGSLLLAVLALGFVANGVLELIRARYRRIALRPPFAPDLGGRL